MTSTPAALPRLLARCATTPATAHISSLSGYPLEALTCTADLDPATYRQALQHALHQTGTDTQHSLAVAVSRPDTPAGTWALLPGVPLGPAFLGYILDRSHHTLNEGDIAVVIDWCAAHPALISPALPLLPPDAQTQVLRHAPRGSAPQRLSPREQAQQLRRRTEQQQAVHDSDTRTHMVLARRGRAHQHIPWPTLPTQGSSLLEVAHHLSRVVHSSDRVAATWSDVMVISRDYSGTTHDLITALGLTDTGPVP